MPSETLDPSQYAGLIHAVREMPHYADKYRFAVKRIQRLLKAYWIAEEYNRFSQPSAKSLDRARFQSRITNYIMSIK